MVLKTGKRRNIYYFGFTPIQKLISAKCVPILHKMEQVSSDKHVGTLAENLLEALKDDSEAAQKVSTI